MRRTRTTKTSPHSARITGKTIRSQVYYPSSPAGLQTARFLIAAKLRNSRSLLTNYRQQRKRKGSPDADLIEHVQARIAYMRSQLEHASCAQDIFLLEARAASAYWDAIRCICKQSCDWRRAYPKASDPLNLLLNIGYTHLYRTCKEALVSAGLMPQLGILHGHSGPDPLAYDMAEVFRQPLVDHVIVPLFSRKKLSRKRLSKKDMSKGYSLIYGAYTKRELYKGKCEKYDSVIKREAIALRNAMTCNTPWKPHAHIWRHGATI